MNKSLALKLIEYLTRSSQCCCHDNISCGPALVIDGGVQHEATRLIRICRRLLFVHMEVILLEHVKLTYMCSVTNRGPDRQTLCVLRTLVNKSKAVRVEAMKPYKVSTGSELWRKVEMNGGHHAPAALYPKKEPQCPVNRKLFGPKG
jgi:hypothetical protein